MANQESRSPTSSPGDDSRRSTNYSASKGSHTGSGDGTRGTYNVASRRFLSLCMEDIEPVMEMRGKDAMYQCCYCSKWCSMSGTRALSKHIENEHRPQVVAQIQGFLGVLDLKLQPSESKIVYIGFLPLAHWNVHLEAAIQCSQDSQQWASLLPIHDVHEGTGTARLHLKMTSAKPYLPRPTWSDSEHARQRVGIRISESLEGLSQSHGGAGRAPTGFAIKVEAPAKALTQPLEAEIILSLRVHGKEAAIVLPLTISPSSQPTQGASCSPVTSSVHDELWTRGLGEKRERTEDAGSPSKLAKVETVAELAPGMGASGLSQLVAAQHQAMAQMAYQAMPWTIGNSFSLQPQGAHAIMSAQHAYPWFFASGQGSVPMQGLPLGNIGINAFASNASDAAGNLMQMQLQKQ